MKTWTLPRSIRRMVTTHLRRSRCAHMIHLSVQAGSWAAGGFTGQASQCLTPMPHQQNKGLLNDIVTRTGRNVCPPWRLLARHARVPDRQQPGICTRLSGLCGLAASLGAARLQDKGARQSCARRLGHPPLRAGRAPALPRRTASGRKQGGTARSIATGERDRRARLRDRHAGPRREGRARSRARST